MKTRQDARTHKIKIEGIKSQKADYKSNKLKTKQSKGLKLINKHNHEFITKV